MRQFIRIMPHRFKCLLIFCIGELGVSIIYPYVCDCAQSHRESSAPGGEMLLWLLGFILAFAYDTYKKGRSLDGKKKAKCD